MVMLPAYKSEGGPKRKEITYVYYLLPKYKIVNLCPSVHDIECDFVQFDE